MYRHHNILKEYESAHDETRLLNKAASFIAIYRSTGNKNCSSDEEYIELYLYEYKDGWPKPRRTMLHQPVLCIVGHQFQCDLILCDLS